MRSLAAKRAPAPEGAASIVLFDGVCNVCNAFVSFVIDRDPKERFRFAPLQSEVGGSLLRRFGLEADDPDTVVLIENGRAHTRSAALLRIARGLGGAWPLLYALVVIPRPARDATYAWLARNRYRWFGKRDQCRVPEPGLERRFL